MKSICKSDDRTQQCHHMRVTCAPGHAPRAPGASGRITEMRRMPRWCTLMLLPLCTLVFCHCFYSSLMSFAFSNSFLVLLNCYVVFFVVVTLLCCYILNINCETLGRVKYGVITITV